MSEDSPAKGVVRFGVAMEGSLLHRYDQYIQRRGYANRSEAIRDLIRAELAQDAWQRGEPIVASLTIVYDHHVHALTERLNAIQHDHGAHVISTMHVHLDHHRCLEVIVAKGPAPQIEAMVNEIVKIRGVLVGKLSTAAAAAPEHE